MRHGDEVHGEVDTDDASGGVAFTLYDAGSVASRALGANEYLVITDISGVVADDGVVVAATDAAGRRVAYLDTGTNLVKFQTPYVCPRGVVPKVLLDSAAAANVVIQGYIQKA